MNNIHTTTRSRETYLRVAAIALFSVAFVLTIPYVGDKFQIVIANQLLNIGILYAVIVGFLMSITLTRRQSLDEYIALELNKIRRIYHLGLHIAKENPKLAQWFNELSAALFLYLKQFEVDGLSNYEKGGSYFRKVTYCIYGLPLQSKSYNSDLYGALLDAASSVTEAREQISSVKNNRIGHFQWTVSIIIALTFCWIIALSTPSDAYARVVTTIVIFNVLLMLLLLYEYDQMNEKKKAYFANLYANNLNSVEQLISKQVTPGKLKRTKS